MKHVHLLSLWLQCHTRVVISIIITKMFNIIIKIIIRIRIIINKILILYYYYYHYYYHSYYELLLLLFHYYYYYMIVIIIIYVVVIINSVMIIIIIYLINSLSVRVLYQFFKNIVSGCRGAKSTERQLLGHFYYQTQVKLSLFILLTRSPSWNSNVCFEMTETMSFIMFFCIFVE